MTWITDQLQQAQDLITGAADLKNTVNQNFGGGGGTSGGGTVTAAPSPGSNTNTAAGQYDASVQGLGIKPIYVLVGVVVFFVGLVLLIRK